MKAEPYNECPLCGEDDWSVRIDHYSEFDANPQSLFRDEDASVKFNCTECGTYSIDFAMTIDIEGREEVDEERLFATTQRALDASEGRGR